MVKRGCCNENVAKVTVLKVTVARLFDAIVLRCYCNAIALLQLFDILHLFADFFKFGLGIDNELCELCIIGL